MVHSKIKENIKKFQQTDAFIFLTFSFSAVGLTHKPIIQFCDWTYDHYFQYFQMRKPNFFEYKCVKREDSQINGSDLVFPLFPSVSEYMNKKYTSKVVYLGNVINSICKSEDQEILKIKKYSEKILFIGSPKYIEGANALILAFKTLKKAYPSMSLHFIGLNESDFKQIQVPNDVLFYGYLDKGNNEQRDIYYRLMKEAKVFVNTTPKWSAFSASIEAMYFYTPVIVPSYEEFTKTFGIDFKGGVFCNDNSLLSEKIESLLKNESYEQICVNANKLVSEFTWSSYIDKILNEIIQL
jgi:glycosyltransferase involved in cell wall biosynthesis